MEHDELRRSARAHLCPLGNATPDYFGGHRTPEMEQYASSVVALDVTNGSVRWPFQTVHHDIWDYDVPSQPALVDLPQADGTVIPALVQGTKRGELFVLDRRDGKPIAAVRSGRCRKARSNGDFTAKTQPFSVGMPHFRDDWSEADMWGITPFDQMWCRIEFKKHRYEGHFTPPINGRNDPIPRECRRLQLGKRRDRRGSAAARRESTHHGQPADPLST